MPFEGLYLTFYLSSIDIFLPYRTFLKVFDFKALRAWPWPLTFRGHLSSKIFLPLESPYMISYLTSIDTFSLSRTVFQIFDFKVFRIWPWPLTFRGHLGSKIFLPFESPYMTSYLTSIDTLSISYLFRENSGQNFQGQTKWRILTFSRSRSSTDIFHF